MSVSERTVTSSFPAVLYRSLLYVRPVSSSVWWDVPEVPPETMRYVSPATRTSP